jgi:hypothetical protein
MALPINVTTVTVTGQYIDFTGTPIAGQVKFTNPQFLVNSAADRLIVPTTITATLDNTGAFSVTIPITNDADLSPLNFTYTYEESFPGGATFTIALPASLGGTVDISDLRTTDTVVNYYQPVSGLVWPLLVARVAQEEEDLDDDPKLLAAPTYENLSLYLDTYADLPTEFGTYASVDGDPLNPELNFTEARIQAIIDRIADLYDYTASNLELRDTDNLGVVTSTTYAGLTAKRGTYSGLAANTSPSTYAAAANGVSWSYAQVGTLITQLGHALAGTGTLTDPYLSITRSNTDGSYGALGLQGFTYATLASTYPTYASPTGAVFTFTYRDTADTIRDESNRINRLMLIGAKQ